MQVSIVGLIELECHTRVWTPKMGISQANTCHVTDSLHVSHHQYRAVFECHSIATWKCQYVAGKMSYWVSIEIAATWLIYFSNVTFLHITSCLQLLGYFPLSCSQTKYSWWCSYTIPILTCCCCSCKEIRKGRQRKVIKSLQFYRSAAVNPTQEKQRKVLKASNCAPRASTTQPFFWNQLASVQHLQARSRQRILYVSTTKYARVCGETTIQIETQDSLVVLRLRSAPKCPIRRANMV